MGEYNLVSTLLTKIKRRASYDITLFQTPSYGDEKGYKPVYRLSIDANGHKNAIEQVYRLFNVTDLMPNDYQARFVGTGDIVFIDEGRGGQTYYKLLPGGWKIINRVHIR